MFPQAEPVPSGEFYPGSRQLSHAIPVRQEECEISVWMVS